MEITYVRPFKRNLTFCLQAVNHPNDAAPDEDQDLVMMPPSGDPDLICKITLAELDNPMRKYILQTAHCCPLLPAY